MRFYKIFPGNLHLLEMRSHVDRMIGTHSSESPITSPKVSVDPKANPPGVAVGLNTWTRHQPRVISKSSSRHRRDVICNTQRKSHFLPDVVRHSILCAILFFSR